MLRGRGSLLISELRSEDPGIRLSDDGPELLSSASLPTTATATAGYRRGSGWALILEVPRMQQPFTSIASSTTTTARKRPYLTRRRARLAMTYATINSLRPSRCRNLTRTRSRALSMGSESKRKKNTRAATKALDYPREAPELS